MTRRVKAAVITVLIGLLFLVGACGLEGGAPGREIGPTPTVWDLGPGI